MIQLIFYSFSPVKFIPSHYPANVFSLPTFVSVLYLHVRLGSSHSLNSEDFLSPSKSCMMQACQTAIQPLNVLMWPLVFPLCGSEGLRK